MAASRYSPESEYRDLSFTVENKTSPEDERRTYEFALTNTGKGYISYYEGFTYKAGDIRYTYMSPKVDNVLLNSELIKPGDEFTIVLSTDSDFNDYESGSFATYAYVDIDNSLEYVGSKSISQKERDDGSYFYTIDCEIKNMRDSYDYEYTFIVTINYEGKDYAFKSDLKY